MSNIIFHGKINRNHWFILIEHIILWNTVNTHHFQKIWKIIINAVPSISRPTHANRHPDFLDFFLSNLPNYLHTNISNLIDLASDHTPASLIIQATIGINPLLIKHTNWNKFPNIMTTYSSLNLKLKNCTDNDNAINILTKNIQDAFQISFTTSQTQDNTKNNITPKIKELILLKRRARNTWQRTHYPVDRHRYSYFSNKLKATLKMHKNHLYTYDLCPLQTDLFGKKHKTVIPLLRQ